MKRRHLPRTWFRGRTAAWQNRDVLRTVQTALVFVGYPRSGHTLMGALLDAHPAVRISHELNLVRHHRMGLGRDALLGLIFLRHAWFRGLGRRWGTFDYSIPGQDVLKSLHVIGDKAGGLTTTQLLRHPSCLDELQDTLGLPLRLVHHVRDPWDQLAAVRNRDKLSADDAIEALARRVRHLEPIVRRPSCLTTYHDQLCTNPEQVLRTVASFLELEPDPTWLSDCCARVDPAASRPGSTVEWTPEQIAAIEHLLASAPWYADQTGP